MKRITPTIAATVFTVAVLFGTVHLSPTPADTTARPHGSTN